MWLDLYFKPSLIFCEELTADQLGADAMVHVRGSSNLDQNGDDTE